ncbi:diguanylate cyclase domain-containing protein [Clostridium grantii]|uniref:Diguanylate cyclase (GGDEF) domain-containing protein n=1 Tax=Clostridium grantii DSM 8605 TaxID=1121316 RepID=A0A1M5XW30_9CLOT|nr:diguanylate cyclase [Clostridium grantii]SHI03764.1 diguanylate cyclase (GGDEF) domain-containing protein [Clostridium grantii DSM 8605]
MENKDIIEMYNHNLHKELISMGRIASVTSFILMPLFYFKDIFMTQYAHSTFFWRLLPIVVSILFILLSFSKYHNSYRIIKYAYLAILYSVLIMMFGLFYINYGTKNGRFNSFLIAGLITSLLIIQIFSSPVRKYIISFSIAVILFFIATFTLKGGDLFIISNLLNPVATVVLISVFSYINEKKSFSEFKSKVLLELSERELINEMEYRKSLENQLKNEVLHDPLTTIYNKKAAEKILTKKIEQFNKENRIFSLVFVDLDDLKTINDNKGHDAGDKYIISFTEMVTDFLGKNKYMFRVGGDEFLIFFEDKELDATNNIMELITDICLSKNIKFSYGTSFSNSSKLVTLYAIIREADIKMYNQKRRKKQLDKPEI